MARVTALRERRNGRVAVDLDGDPWRELPVDAVVRAGLLVGGELDRPRARELRRELRRSEALAAAARTLRYQDLPARALEQRLQRGAHATRARADALDTLVAAGVVDDARFATSRARSMAERGYGDEAIRHDLARQGVEGELVETAVAALEPERKRARAAIRRRGTGIKTARYLAAKGFGEDAVESALDGAIADEAG